MSTADDNDPNHRSYSPVNTTEYILWIRTKLRFNLLIWDIELVIHVSTFLTPCMY